MYLRGDIGSCDLVPEMERAKEVDWSTEYLDSILSVKLVDGVDGLLNTLANMDQAIQIA